MLAGLIDANHAPAAMIEGLLAEIARFGEATVKRIYGDLELSGDDAGWAHLGTFGSYLTKLQPDFESRF